MPDSSHGSESVVDTYIVFLLEGASSHLTTEKIRPQETIVFILKTLICGVTQKTSMLPSLKLQPHCSSLSKFF